MYKILGLIFAILCILIPNSAQAVVDHFEIEFGKQQAQVNELVDITITAIDKDDKVETGFTGKVLLFSTTDFSANYSKKFNDFTYIFTENDKGKVFISDAISYSLVGKQDLQVYYYNNDEINGIAEIEIVPKDNYIVKEEYEYSLIKNYSYEIDKAYKILADKEDLNKLYRIEKVINKIIYRYNIGDEISYKEAILYNLALYIKDKNEKLITSLLNQQTIKKSIPIHLDHFEVELLKNNAKMGEKIDLMITAIDSRGNIMQDYQGEVLIFSEFDLDAEFSPPINEQIFTFTKGDKGKVYIEDAVNFTKKGLMNVWVYDLIDDKAYGVGEIEISSGVN